MRAFSSAELRTNIDVSPTVFQELIGGTPMIKMMNWKEDDVKARKTLIYSSPYIEGPTSK
jgi:hypothetical protein